MGTYETGWRETELHSAFPLIGLEKVRFQQYDMPLDVANFVPPHSDYTGDPTEEIDAAWEKLIAPNVILLSETEIGSYASQTFSNGTGFYSGQVALYQHVYGKPDLRALRRLDHCVDLLREANQCHMDMTPMLFNVSAKNGRTTFALKRHNHTCRKFDVLHEWALSKTAAIDLPFMTKVRDEHALSYLAIFIGLNMHISAVPYTIARFEPHLEEFTANYTSAKQSRTVRDRWTKLFPRKFGGGTVRINDHEEYEFLGVPFSDPDKTLGALYQVSWTHQLHRLYYLMDAYDQLVQKGPMGFESVLSEDHHSVHTNHCFDYLRQAIICNADMTLEGGVPGEEKGTDGFGHAHICRDPGKVIQWIEGKRINDEIHF
ncbi:hypothetical protein CMUS01_14404 [Colletotrichum musicola]|uniref:Uncharacterized protein n=1 Tax=Colletotrichum musicola TaxID=2175873 RepID=A0A8H6MRC5_9PEZI|nr:hypothetical protein CMUS01_14404 [Colletotrichum musicola]